ncbi:hypothetical protein [Pedobacter sp.]|uniref:hypothetical protein n=1 Tax=Pedobacter sp. TaxID=1411316 RepID=UPI003D7FDA4D
MKPIILLFIAALGVAILPSCKEKQDAPEIQLLSTGENEALGAYFTKDHRGNAVLCWSEKSAADSLYCLKYAIYNAEKESFELPVTVAGSIGLSTAAESMGKIAFKGDGTVMAIFGKRFTKEKNPYAGATYYTFSTDEGKSWTKAAFLHSDTSHTVGRSFFDLTTLKDGEMAAVWLDGRYGKSIKGSALFFARTAKGKGFAADVCIDKGTCECCRTNLVSDTQGNLHLAYRKILYSRDLMGKQVRDMVYSTSKDNGLSFSKAIPISNDNWQIEGCPHSGPSLALTDKSVQSVWFTAGGVPGIYFTEAQLDSTFKKRTLLSAEGRHPQMKTLPEGKMAVVYEENMGAVPEHSMHHQNAGMAKIVLSLIDKGQARERISLTDGQYADHHAVLIPLKKGLLVAWIREMHGQSKIYFSKITS